MIRSTARSDTAVGMYSRLPLPSAVAMGQKTHGRSLKTTGVVCHFVGYARPIQSPSTTISISWIDVVQEVSTYRLLADSCWNWLPRSYLADRYHHLFRALSLLWLFCRTSRRGRVGHPSSWNLSVMLLVIRSKKKREGHSLISRKFLNAYCRRTCSATTAYLVIVFEIVRVDHSNNVSVSEKTPHTKHVRVRTTTATGTQNVTAD